MRIIYYLLPRTYCLFAIVYYPLSITYIDWYFVLGTRIDIALRFTAANVFEPNHGDRPEVLDVAVLLTDGKSDPGSESLSAAAKPLTEEGVHVIAVGLGDDIDQVELNSIITNKENGLFLIKDISEMVNYVGRLSKEICQCKCSSFAIYSFNIYLLMATIVGHVLPRIIIGCHI